jgi:aarF domain-containing kinase
MHLADSMAQFSETIAAQTHLDIEGDSLEEFNKNFPRDERWGDILFPVPIIKTPSVLVETFVPGISVAKVVTNFLQKRVLLREAVQKNSPSNEKRTKQSIDEEVENLLNFEEQDHEIRLAHFVVTRGEDLYLKMLLQDNFMHADLHPGNILVSNENRVFKIALVDAGLVAKPNAEESESFIGLLSAIGEGNGDEAANCILGFSPEKNFLSRPFFNSDMVSLFSKICRGYGTNVNLAEVLKGVLQV